MKINKIVTKLALASALLGTVGTTSISTILNTNIVNAEVLQTSSTKYYNRLQQNAQKDGITYTKPRFYNNWVPGNNVADYYTMKPYKLSGSLIDPGRQWDKVIGSGTVHGRSFFVIQDSSGNKGLIPSEFYHVPYGFKFKKNHKPVECYYGSLAESENGYNEYLDEYEGGYTKVNTIYSDHENGHRELTMAIDGQHNGKNPGFFIGLTPVHMSDGEDYYPVYSYTTSDVLGVVYIKTADIDQFEPAKVTYKYIGTLNKSNGSSYYHSFKPYKNKVNY